MKWIVDAYIEGNWVSDFAQREFDAEEIAKQWIETHGPFSGCMHMRARPAGK
jgi:hypothetical protein